MALPKTKRTYEDDRRGFGFDKIEDVQGFCEMNLQKKPKSPKLPKCKICKTGFVRQRALQQVCSYNDNPECAKEFAKQKSSKDGIKEARIARVEHRKAKTAAKPLRWWEERCQSAVNAYVVKVRDKGEGCISCGTRNPNIQYCAGHFRTRKAASQHRYNLDNLHKQCNHHCNMQLSGNIQNYRPALITKIGLDKVDALINDNSTRRYTIPELDEMTKDFRRMLREAEKDLPEYD